MLWPHSLCGVIGCRSASLQRLQRGNQWLGCLQGHQPTITIKACHCCSLDLLDLLHLLCLRPLYRR